MLEFPQLCMTKQTNEETQKQTSKQIGESWWVPVCLKLFLASGSFLPPQSTSSAAPWADTHNRSCTYLWCLWQSLSLSSFMPCNLTQTIQCLPQKLPQPYLMNVALYLKLTVYCDRSKNKNINEKPNCPNYRLQWSGLLDKLLQSGKPNFSFPF